MCKKPINVIIHAMS